MCTSWLCLGSQNTTLSQHVSDCKAEGKHGFTTFQGGGTWSRSSFSSFFLFLLLLNWKQMGLRDVKWVDLVQFQLGVRTVFLVDQQSSFHCTCPNNYPLFSFLNCYHVPCRGNQAVGSGPVALGIHAGTAMSLGLMGSGPRAEIHMVNMFNNVLPFQPPSWDQFPTSLQRAWPPD